MALSRRPMMDVHYDWDSGLWRAEVRSGDGLLLAYRTCSEEQEAEDAMVELRRRLARAPAGDTQAVLQKWAEWLAPSLIPRVSGR